MRSACSVAFIQRSSSKLYRPKNCDADGMLSQASWERASAMGVHARAQTMPSQCMAVPEHFLGVQARACCHAADHSAARLYAHCRSSLLQAAECRSNRILLERWLRSLLGGPSSSTMHNSNDPGFKVLLSMSHPASSIIAPNRSKEFVREMLKTGSNVSCTERICCKNPACYAICGEEFCSDCMSRNTRHTSNYCLKWGLWCSGGSIMASTTKEASS